MAWALNAETGRTRFTVETRADLLACEKLEDWRYSVDMGAPRFGWREIPLAHTVADTIHVPIETAKLNARLPSDFTAVSMGNPHAIFFVADVEAHDLARVGPLLETDPLFPERANISLAAVTASDA